MILAPKAKPIIRAKNTPSVQWTFINSERKSLNLGNGDIWDLDGFGMFRLQNGRLEVS